VKILYLGDIVGKKGIDAIEIVLPLLREKYHPNIVLVNAENATNGKGLSKKDYKRIMGFNISGISMGNHTFRNPEINEYIDSSKICRPMNIANVKGQGFIDINFNGKTITLINLIGTINMKIQEETHNPFNVIEEFLANHKSDITIVDMHSETTSEKLAMGFFLDGKVNAVVGTHTHIQTNDARVLPNGTLYISDMGMCGSIDSILGVKKEIIIDRLKNNGTQAFKLEDNGPSQVSGVLLDFDKHKISLIHEEIK